MILNEKRVQELSRLEADLQVCFQDKRLLSLALTHISFVNENKLVDFGNNERLEFLGDSILKFSIAEKIYSFYPGKNEGELSKLQAVLVRDSLLFELAQKYNIGKYILFGRNEEKNNGAQRDSNLANALEAVYGALCLDQGSEIAKQFIQRLYQKYIVNPELLDKFLDSKTRLQEYSQGENLGLPIYSVIEETGPDHNKTFTVKVEFKSDTVHYEDTGQGRSKKVAEQEAAGNLLNKIISLGNLK